MFVKYFSFTIVVTKMPFYSLMVIPPIHTFTFEVVFVVGTNSFQILPVCWPNFLLYLLFWVVYTCSYTVFISIYYFTWPLWILCLRLFVVCAYSIGHCIVCPSSMACEVHLWYLQTFLWIFSCHMITTTVVATLFKYWIWSKY